MIWFRTLISFGMTYVFVLHQRHLWRCIVPVRRVRSAKYPTTQKKKTTKQHIKSRTKTIETMENYLTSFRISVHAMNIYAVFFCFFFFPAMNSKWFDWWSFSWLYGWMTMMDMLFIYLFSLSITLFIFSPSSSRVCFHFTLLFHLTSSESFDARARARGTKNYPLVYKKKRYEK